MAKKGWSIIAYNVQEDFLQIFFKRLGLPGRYPQARQATRHTILLPVSRDYVHASQTLPRPECTLRRLRGSGKQYLGSLMVIESAGVL